MAKEKPNKKDKKKKFKPAYKMTNKEKQKHYDDLANVKIEDCEE